MSDELLFSVHTERDPKLIARGWRQPTSEDKSLWMPWQKSRAQGNLATLRSAILRFCWSPIIWRNGERKKDNFVAANLLVLDFDNGLLTTDDMFPKFIMYKYLVAPTKSHLKEKNGVVCERFRLIAKLDRTIYSAQEYTDITRMWAQVFSADEAATDAARAYQPSIQIDYVGDWENGKEIMGATPPKFVSPQPPLKYNLNSNGETYAIKAWERGIPEGGRNRAAFQAACDWAKIGLPCEHIFQKMRPFADSATFPDHELIQCIRSAMARKT